MTDGVLKSETYLQSKHFKIKFEPPLKFTLDKEYLAIVEDYCHY